jgi:hypothetical protein
MDSKKKLSLKLSDYGSVPNTPEFAKHQKDFLEELFYRDRIVPTWKNLGQMASRMFDDPQDVLDILVENADKTLKATDLKRFYLTQFIEDERDKKINKGKGLRTVISENLENCCKLINIPFHTVGASKTQMNENPKLKDEGNVYTFDQIVERVDRKYRRVMDASDVKREFNKWRKEEFRRKEFNDFLKKPTPKNKK